MFWTAPAYDKAEERSVMHPYVWVENLDSGIDCATSEPAGSDSVRTMCGRVLTKGRFRVRDRLPQVPCSDCEDAVFGAR
jgi:hypothetical protein